jgi:hypothetical protein
VHCALQDELQRVCQSVNSVIYLIFQYFSQG